MSVFVRFWVLYALIFIAASQSVAAQSMVALEAKLLEHPSLRVYNFRAEASRERAVVAGALPDPEISVGINNFPFTDPGFDRYLPTNKAIGIRQVFPSRAGRDAHSAKARQQAVYLELVREARFAQLRAELIILMHEDQRIAQQRVLAQQREELYMQLLDTIAAQVDAGEPVVHRLAQVALESTEEERILADLAAEQLQVEARFIDLVGQVPVLPPPAVVVVDWGGDPSQFHTVRLARAEAGIAATDVDQAQAAWKPSWGAELVYQQRDAGDGEPGSNFDGDDWVSGRVTFTVPLWARGRQDPGLRAAQADKAAADAETLAVGRAAIANHAALAAQRSAGIEKVRILREKVRIFEDQLESLTTLYESGAGNYADLLDAEIAILTLRSQTVAERSRIAATCALINALLVTT